MTSRETEIVSWYWYCIIIGAIKVKNNRTDVDRLVWRLLVVYSSIVLSAVQVDY